MYLIDKRWYKRYAPLFLEKCVKIEFKVIAQFLLYVYLVLLFKPKLFKNEKTTFNAGINQPVGCCL